MGGTVAWCPGDFPIRMSTVDGVVAPADRCEARRRVTMSR